MYGAYIGMLYGGQMNYLAPITLTAAHGDQTCLRKRLSLMSDRDILAC
jgi:hypothetical protein